MRSLPHHQRSSQSLDPINFRPKRTETPARSHSFNISNGDTVLKGRSAAGPTNPRSLRKFCDLNFMASRSECVSGILCRSETHVRGLGNASKPTKQIPVARTLFQPITQGNPKGILPSSLDRYAASANSESRTPKLIMPDTNTNLHDAITEGNVTELHSKILASEFVLLSTSKAEDNEDENVGALTAEIGDFEVLVAFTSEENAGAFVQEMGELFGEDESVDGILVEGAAMLEYLPEGYGLLLDPELENSSIMDPRVTAEILALQK